MIGLAKMKTHVFIADPPPRKWYRPKFSPFNKRGNINIVYVTDMWWMKLWARITRKGVWTKIGAYTDD